MSNINDPDFSTRDRNLKRADDTSYAGWIIGGLVALAVILGIVFLLPMNNSNTASNNNNTNTSSRAASPPASTTGAGATSPDAAAPKTPPAGR